MDPRPLPGLGGLGIAATTFLNAGMMVPRRVAVIVKPDRTVWWMGPLSQLPLEQAPPGCYVSLNQVDYYRVAEAAERADPNAREMIDVTPKT